MGFAVLAFFYVVASSQIFPQINIAFYFGVQRYAIIAKNAIYFDKKVERGEKSLIKDSSPLSNFTFYLSANNFQRGAGSKPSGACTPGKVRELPYRYGYDRSLGNATCSRRRARTQSCR